MLFTSLPTETLPDQADAIELRLDLFPQKELKFIKNILKKSPYPVLFTARNQTPAQIEELLSLHPPFFDIDASLPPQFLKKILNGYPDTQFILSHHEFEKAPRDLDSIFLPMKAHRVYAYKIACRVQSTSDALRMLLFARGKTKLNVICMGEIGSFARVLGFATGNFIGYAKFQEPTASGQLSFSEMSQVYRIQSISPKTALYGLIGDPVLQSVSHLHHNGVFSQKNIDAVYVKMNVKAEELGEFIPLAKKIGFRGLSVTMPLKEKIIPFLDEIDEEAKKVGAVNTLFIRNGKIFGTNTDGKGVFDAIEKRISVRNKKVVLLGAGGAARAIAFEAVQRGSHLVILNRTKEKAKKLSDLFHSEAGSLNEVPSNYDLLINATSHPMPIAKEKIIPQSFIVDILRPPLESLLLKEASHLDCTTIDGQEMFLNQAKRQTDLWLNS